MVGVTRAHNLLSEHLSINPNGEDERALSERLKHSLLTGYKACTTCSYVA